SYDQIKLVRFHRLHRCLVRNHCRLGSGFAGAPLHQSASALSRADLLDRLLSRRQHWGGLGPHQRRRSRVRRRADAVPRLWKQQRQRPEGWWPDGCDYQFASKWVIGIQGKAEFDDINSSNLVAAFPGITAAFRLRNTETLTARLGYTIAPTVLAYVKGGAAWANGNAAATALGLAGETADFNMTGYTVGSGVEWMFAPGWSVFGEYNYMNFGTKNFNFLSTGFLPGFGPAGALADTNAIRLTAQEAIVGVNYKFNWGGPVLARY